MTTKTLGLIHTSATLVPVFSDLCKRHLPGIHIFNIVDDSLIRNTIASGKLTPDTSRRVVGYARSAEEAGADFILFTCSSIGPAVELASSMVNVPVIRVDRPMADKAMTFGSRIGVVATLTTTLEPTADLVRRRGIAAGKNADITSVCCEAAFDALMSGDSVTHDRRVREALLQLSQTCDVIVLAQASMARVVETMPPEDRKVPILASPVLAMEYLSEFLTLD
jgi:Asp/Glu/hydantoin racemase